MAKSKSSKKSASLDSVFSKAWKAKNNPVHQEMEDPGLLQKLAQYLYGTDASRDALNAQYVAQSKKKKGALGIDDFLSAQAGYAADPVGIGKGGGLKNTLGLLGANIKAHPLKTAGTATLGATTLAGLFDNDRIGGQLIGTIGGLLAPAALKGLNSKWTFGPLGKANLAMAGSSIGALFDMLKSKQDREEDAMRQQQMMYRR